MKFVSPSYFAVRALGLECVADGGAINGDQSSCGLCGASLAVGESVTHFEPPEDWDATHIHPTRGPYVCMACSVLVRNNEVLTRYSRAVFVENGVYRLTKAQDVVWLVTKAKPPFLAVFNTKKSAQMIWHTPVTLDNRAIAISWGDVSGVIRVDKLKMAYESLARLSVAYNQMTGANFQWPVQGLSLRDDEAQMLELLPSHSHKLRSLKDQNILQDLNNFDDLRICEKWVLSAILLTSVNLGLSWCDIPSEIPPMLVMQYGENKNG